MANERYTLTRPKTAAGEKAGFFQLLERMIDGTQISEYQSFNMTAQALRERNLIVAKDRKGYVITENGRAYVCYVNSTNKPSKKFLKLLMQGD